MNKNIDLTKILKNCPIGTKLYLTLCGKVKLTKVENSTYPICVENSNGDRFWLTQDGKYISGFDGECILFPSREQRDWSKFTAPWQKRGKFNPNTLQPFDKVLVRDSRTSPWRCALYSHTIVVGTKWKYVTGYSTYDYCISYNDNTKNLVGTTNEAPEYYRYWEE